MRSTERTSPTLSLDFRWEWDHFHLQVTERKSVACIFTSQDRETFFLLIIPAESSFPTISHEWRMTESDERLVNFAWKTGSTKEWLHSLQVRKTESKKKTRRQDASHIFPFYARNTFHFIPFYVLTGKEWKLSECDFLWDFLFYPPKSHSDVDGEREKGCITTENE